MRHGQILATTAMLLLATAWGRGDLPPDDPRITPVVKAYRKAHTSLVNISTKRIVRARLGLFGNDPFDEIFPSPFSRRVPVRSLGSGFLLHPDGYIVTNAHVVRKATEVTVTLADQETAAAAQVISVDPTYDLAVIRIDPPDGKPLPHLPLARSDDLMVGEKVIAIGNPLGYANSLTTGVISAIDRTLHFRGGVKYEKLIQIDAPINPGNSGGALLNIKGELIGINTAIRADAQNIGFAIPIDLLAEELPRMLDFERINRVAFGADVRQRHTEAGTEVYVRDVRPGTPAAEALRPGDVLARLNGEPVAQIPDYSCAMLSAEAGEPIRLDVRRGERRLELTVKLAARPKPDVNKLLRTRFGMSVREITPGIARQMRLFVDAGLLVTEVEAKGPAAEIGLQPGDVLFQFDRFYVKNLEDLGSILEDLETGGKIRIGVMRRNIAAWATIETREASETPSTGDGPRMGV